MHDDAGGMPRNMYTHGSKIRSDVMLGTMASPRTEGSVFSASGDFPWHLSPGTRTVGFAVFWFLGSLFKGRQALLKKSWLNA